MKKHVALGTALGLASFIAGAQMASAQQANFPTVARGLTSWMARAMDECSPSTVSVTSSNVPNSGCLQVNSVTDDSLSMNFTRIRVTRRGSIGIFGRGFALGDAVRVRLALRVTKSGINTTGGPNKKVTFADQVVDCPKSPDAFLARPNGAVVGRTDLAACLDQPGGGSALARGNLEILSASLVNVDNGKIVGTTGLLR